MKPVVAWLLGCLLLLLLGTSALALEQRSAVVETALRYHLTDAQGIRVGQITIAGPLAAQLAVAPTPSAEVLTLGDQVGSLVVDAVLTEVSYYTEPPAPEESRFGQFGSRGPAWPELTPGTRLAKAEIRFTNRSSAPVAARHWPNIVFWGVADPGLYAPLPDLSGSGMLGLGNRRGDAAHALPCQDLNPGISGMCEVWFVLPVETEIVSVGIVWPTLHEMPAPVIAVDEEAQ